MFITTESTAPLNILARCTTSPTSIVLIKVQDSVKKSSIVDQGFGLPDLMSPLKSRKANNL